MHRRLRIAGILSWLLALHPLLQSQTPQEDWHKGVVSVAGDTLGSGFIIGITPQGAEIVTVGHVVKDAIPRVTFNSEQLRCGKCATALPGRVIGTWGLPETEKDAVKLILVPNPPASAVAMAGRMEYPERGAELIAAGYPQEEDGQESEIPSAVTSLSVGKKISFLPAPAIGISGGPLVLKSTGQVVGMQISGASFGTAVPVDVISGYLRSSQKRWPADAPALDPPARVSDPPDRLYDSRATPSAAPNSQTDSVKLVSISPESSSTLVPGQSVTIRAQVAYNLASADTGRLVLIDRPAEKSAGRTGQTLTLQRGSGTVTLSATVVVPETRNWGISVPLFVGNSTSTSVVAGASYAVAPPANNGNVGPAGTTPPPDVFDSIKLISITPAPGAILRVSRWEDITAKIQYTLAKAATGRISLVVSANGKREASKEQMVTQGRGTVTLSIPVFIPPTGSLVINTALYLGNSTNAAAADDDGITFKVNGFFVVPPPAAQRPATADSAKLMSLSPVPNSFFEPGQKVKIRAQVQYSLTTAASGRVGVVIQTEKGDYVGMTSAAVKRGKGTITFETDILMPKAGSLDVFAPLYAGLSGSDPDVYGRPPVYDFSAKAYTVRQAVGTATPRAAETVTIRGR